MIFSVGMGRASADHDVEHRIAQFWQRVDALGPGDYLSARDLGQWALNVIERNPRARTTVTDFRSSAGGMQAAMDRAGLAPVAASPPTGNVEQRIAQFWARVDAMQPGDFLSAADLGQWALNVIERNPRARITVTDFRFATARMQGDMDRAGLAPVAVTPPSTPPPPPTSPTPVVMPSGIRDLNTFLAACPTSDPVYGRLLADLPVLIDGRPGPPPNCAVYDGQLETLQALRTAFHMEPGRSVSYPWTSGALYDWFVAEIDGFDIRADAANSWCCERIDGRVYVVLMKKTLFDRSWRGLSAWLGLLAHEARHVHGPGHVDCVTRSSPGGCDLSYNETNLSSYGIQYWLNKAWLMGSLNVGLGCLSATERATYTEFHLNYANVYPAAFVSPPPALTMPPVPGGTCPP